MAILKKPYKISIWRDKLETNASPSYYKEIQIAVIGSDTMTSPNKAFSPVLTVKNNGEVTFTFSMAYKYFDPGAQAEVINPFIGYLIEERKVKLHYDGEWYDFLVKNHEEDSETNIWTYTCTDAFVNELSKVGYNIEFSTELGNNQGTAVELARETLKNTDWEVSDSDTLIQRVKEPMCRYTVSGSFTALNTDTNVEDTIEDEEIYVFYSFIANKNTKFVQFMRASDEPNFTFDSNNVIIGTNYRILTDVVYTTNEQTGLTSFDVKSAGANPVTLATASPVTGSGDRPQYTDKQGFRLAYSQLTTYDSVMGRTVDVYQTTNEPIKRVYDFVDSTYTTSDVVMSYVTNGSNFNVYENGSLQGWSNSTPYTPRQEGGQSVDKPQEIGLTTYPEVAPGVELVKLTDITRITGYLELRFNNPLTQTYENTFFNSGFEDNSRFVDHITKGEKYILRLAAATATEKHGDLEPLNLSTSNGKIRAIVAKYKSEENREGGNLTYVNTIDPDGIILNFNDENEPFEENNTIITGGTFDEDMGAYRVDGVVQEPSSECVYVDSAAAEYVWSDEQKKYVPKAEANWFVNYYRTITEALQPLSNSWLSEPTNKIGIFLYVDNAELCNSTYVYISDVQITKGIEYKKPNGDIDYVSIGNVPTATIKETHNYYEKPEENADKTSVDIYFDLSDLENKLGSEIKPVYNENSEKILSISEAQSNCFNILQTICETFECWLKLEVEHEDNGAIKLIDGKPIKKVYFKEYAGKDNFAGFKYGVNLNSIQRTVNSDEIVTKLIVDNVQSDYVDSGVMSIRNASANPSGEANILNFSYYTNKGLIENELDCQHDLDDYYANMKELNNQLNEKETERGLLETALTKIEAKRNVYTELLDTAKDKYMEGLADFEKATGIPYNEYVEEYGKVEDIISAAPVDPSDIDTTDIEIDTSDPTPEDTENRTFTNLGYGFYVNTEPNNKGVYRANQYFSEYSGEQDHEDKYVTQLCIYKNGGWVTKWKKETSENSFFPEDDVNWYAAWANKNLEDHGASAVETAAQSMVLGDYGYGYYSKENYLAVQLVSNVVSNIEWYRLYHWDKEETEWIEVYGSTSIPVVGEEYYHEWDKAWKNKGRSRNGETTLNDGDLTNHESIIDIIGQLYVSLSTINNYSGLLTNINEEYKEYKEKLKGHPTYDFSVSYVEAEQGWETRLELSDYIDNFKFKVYPESDPNNYLEYESSVSQKSFVATSNTVPFNRIEVTSVPTDYHIQQEENEDLYFLTEDTEVNEEKKYYELIEDEYVLVEEPQSNPSENSYYEFKYELPFVIEVPYGIDWYKLMPGIPMPGYEDAIKEIQEAKDNREKEFFSKYGKFIKEGTWSSNDYIDADLYYLDAMQVSQTSAFPKVEYSINVAEVSELEGLENYTFAAGDKSYIEDTEFFGWAAFYVNNETQEVTYIKPNDLTGYTIGKTPAREEVIVAQVEWHLDEPETNVITVQNYKTQFEDLFQRISATVQQVQYNEATYAKTASILDANGTINQNLLLASLNSVAGELRALTTDGSIEINGSEILVHQNPKTNQLLRIDSQGIGISRDGGVNWSTAIDGDGINLGEVTSSTINTQEVRIGNKDKPSFTWDKYGISAYKYTGEDDPYDLSTFVRFDQYGLYGIQNLNGYKVASLEDVKDKANFGITWDGFFIKNSYTGGGLVQITSDNDFQVINSDGTEKIKIGALEWTNGGTVTTTPISGIAPSLYGIRINNNAGETVFKTGDDGNITITGTINALGGNFTGIVNVGPEDDDHIVIDGENALIKSSNYGGEGATTGWMIDKNGDAVFTNITARGAIRTAVFEYAEIQAVGGIFIFRPSSTIKAARVSGNDLILKVEKPHLFAKVSYDVVDNPTGNPKSQHWYERTNYGYQETEDTEVSSQKDYYIKNEVTNGSWCKISNYTSDGVATDSTIQNILLTNGLTHVYQVTAINTTTKEVTLSGAAVMVTGQNPVTTLEELEGGALVDMGRKDGSSNYGIGVNSSDNTVNLPARAISLFETEIDETREPKVTYKYRGILGTLPELPAASVNTDIYRNMVGTQGIYTDNMYLGDLQQYLAFYTDENGDKKLKISAAQISFEIPDEHGQGSGHYQDVADIEAEGVPGPPGQDAINVKIDSSAGEIFINNVISTILRCYVEKGGVDITNDNNYIKTYTWKKINIIDGSEIPGWTPTPVPLEPNAISIGRDDVDSKAVFQCVVRIEEA